MNISEWISLAALLLAGAGVVAALGAGKAKLAACERRLDNLETVRDRMGRQLHDVDEDVKVLAAVVHERTGGRRQTLARIIGRRGDGEESAPAAAAPPEGEDSGEGGGP